jgi:TPR repeat protein
LREAAEGGSATAAEVLGVAYWKGYGLAQDSALGEELLRKAADAGRTQAAMHLSRIYLHGAPGVRPNTLKARAWLEQAARGGHPDACVEVGVALLRGPEAGHAEGIALLEQAVTGGNSWGQMHLGRAYYAGVGVEQDLERAAQLYARSAAGGNAAGTLAHASLLEAGIGQPANPGLARAVLARLEGRRLAVGVMVGLVRMCEEGVAIPANPARALEWKLRGARAGHEVFRRQLAWAYATGKGVEPDFDAVLEFSTGSGTLCYGMARRYLEGKGVERDPARAEALLRAGVAADHVPCMVALGEELLKRPDAASSTRPGENEGIEWLERAEAAGSNWGRVLLAQALFSGRGCEAEPVRAVALFEQAAEAGSPESAFNLACALEDGVGVERDPARAKELFVRALAELNAARRYDVALRSERGNGVPRSYARAAEWHRHAMDAGSRRGALALGRLLARGQGVERDPVEARRLLEPFAEAGNGLARRLLEELDRRR